MMIRFIPLFFAVAVLVSCNGGGNDGQSDSDSLATDTLGPHATYEALNDQIKENPDDPDLYYQRAGYHTGQKQFEEALADINRSMDIDSENPEYYLFKADVLILMMKTRSAKATLDNCLVIDPENIEANLKLAEMAIWAEDYPKSIDYINDVLRIDVNHARAYFMKGMCYKFMGDTAKAVSSIQTAVEQDPDYYDGYIQLGLIYAGVHDPIAVSYYDNALKVRPESTEALYNRSLFLQEHGDPERAVQGYEQMVEISPADIRAYYNIGYVNMMYFKDFQKGVDFFTRAIALHPGYYQAFYNRGFCKEHLGDLQGAEADFRQSLKIRPDYDLAAKGLSRVVDKDYN